MISQQLLDFIKNQTEKGVIKEEIKKMLLANSWTSQDVEEGFGVVGAQAHQVPQPTPSTVTSETNTASGGFYGYAGFWKRWVALIIDNIILTICAAIIFVPISIIGKKTSGNDIFAVILFVLYIGFFLAHWLYYALMERSS